jgi:hypothetical protein
MPISIQGLILETMNFIQSIDIDASFLLEHLNWCSSHQIRTLAGEFLTIHPLPSEQSIDLLNRIFGDQTFKTNLCVLNICGVAMRIDSSFIEAFEPLVVDILDELDVKNLSQIELNAVITVLTPLLNFGHFTPSSINEDLCGRLTDCLDTNARAWPILAILFRDSTHKTQKARSSVLSQRMNTDGIGEIRKHSRQGVAG